MTLVLALKVGDGVVLGADSATTLAQGSQYMNSYFNAEKLFNLRKGLPLGAVTYGVGGLVNHSIATLAKDLRGRFSNAQDPHWYLDPDSYTVEQVARLMQEHFIDDLFAREIKSTGPFDSVMGFIIAGYSAGVDLAEIWQLEVKGDGTCSGPQLVSGTTQPVGGAWEGITDPINRLLRGWSFEVFNRLTAAGLTADQARALLDSVEPLLNPTMPIQDLIDFVHFLVETTCGYVRFAPGHLTVAKPIDSASITRHEGFRWIRRKHYFERRVNRAAAQGLP